MSAVLPPGQFILTEHVESGRTPAYLYQCMDCDWSLVTVARSDLLPANLDLMTEHFALHVVKI